MVFRIFLVFKGDIFCYEMIIGSDNGFILEIGV